MSSLSCPAIRTLLAVSASLKGAPTRSASVNLSLLLPAQAAFGLRI
jgi:hypothetical protein